MKPKIVYILLGIGIILSVMVICISCSLFTPYNKMNVDHYEKFNSKLKPYKQKIEKNIFQTFGGGAMPEKFKKITKYLKLQNPEYKYHLYDDNDILAFITTHYPEYLESYNMINSDYGAAKADFFRYMVVYHYGGVYFDIKSGASVPLRKIIKPKDEFVSSGWSWLYPEKYINWCIMAKKGHPLLKYVLDGINDAIKSYELEKDGVGQQGVLNLTGPYRYSNILEQHVSKYKIHHYRNIKKSKLIYNYCFKNNMDVLSCGLMSVTAGKVGSCNHSAGIAKKYNVLSSPVVVRSS